MKKNPTIGIFMTAALSALAALALAAFLLLHVRSQGREIAALQDRIAFESSRSGRIADMKASLADTAALRAKLSSRFVTKDSVVDFLNGIEALAAKAGADLKVSSVTEEQSGSGDGPKLPVLHLSLAAQGSWKQVASFGEMLRLLPYQVSFAGVGFSAQRKTALDAKGNPVRSGPSRWKADFDFTVLKEN